MNRSLAIACVAGAASLAGCGTARRSEPISGPLFVASADVREGQIVFMQHCDACHVHGEGGLGPSLNDKPLPDFAVRFQIRNGVGAMPAFSERDIDDRRLDEVVAYVRALRADGEG